MTKWKLFLTKLQPIHQRVFLDASMHSFPQTIVLNFSVSGSTIIICEHKNLYVKISLNQKTRSPFIERVTPLNDETFLMVTYRFLQRIK